MNLPASSMAFLSLQLSIFSVFYFLSQ